MADSIDSPPIGTGVVTRVNRVSHSSALDGVVGGPIAKLDAVVWRCLWGWRWRADFVVWGAISPTPSSHGETRTSLPTGHIDGFGIHSIWRLH